MTATDALEAAERRPALAADAAAASAEDDFPLTLAAGREGARRRRAEPGAAGRRTDQLLLGVFLLLMAFFALLVSISPFEVDRTEAVLESVARSFAARRADEPRRPFVREGEVAAAARSAELRRRLERSLAVVGRSLDAEGETFALTLEADDIFEPLSPALRHDRQVLLGRMAEVVRAGSGAGELVLEVRIGPQPEFGTLPRLAALGRRLVELGVPETRLALGLEPGAGAALTFAFAPVAVRRALPGGKGDGGRS